MSISKKTRFEVFKRDGFKCQYCGRSAPEVILHVDHIQPVAKGGEDDIMNLITSCFDCNMGKSDRLLSDETALAKRKKQLDDLNERREQLEMLMEWQRGLMDLQDDTADKAASHFESLIEYQYDIQDNGKAELKVWIRKFGLAEVLEVAQISVDQYAKRDPEDSTKFTSESINKAFSFIPRICNMRKRTQGREYMRDLYYIRGILKNRLRYVNDYKALQIMEQAYKSGVHIEEIKEIAREVISWSGFQDEIEAATERAGEPDDN